MSKLPNFTPIKSSAMTGFHHDPTSRVLTVQFNGGRAYSYADVPVEKVQAMIENKSPGGYFSSNIKDRHAATKL